MMQCFPKTVVIRHRKENLKKCSLRGLEQREDMLFYTYPRSELPDLGQYVLLAVDAPALDPGDKRGLILLDATWRYAEKMLDWMGDAFERRSLPTGLTTAYPRRQEVEHGLASIEALYAAYRLTGRDTAGLLDHYHWAEAFLAKNKELV